MNQIIIIIILIVLLGSSVQWTYGQKMEKNILLSKNISQIEEYIQKAHPDDPKKNILKKKLIQLKNELWTEGAKRATPMAARPLDASKGIEEGYSLDEEEFYKLMKSKSVEHKEKTVSLLNTLFDSNSQEIILFRNKSDCNIIVKIEGLTNYSLPVPAGKEDFIIVQKGEYRLKSFLCGRPYTSKKNIEKSVIIELNASSKIFEAKK